MNSSNRYLLIGGAPKCGTTSLFRYLADHPEICPSSRKETYFFARDFDYKRVCQVDETLTNFEAYFPHCSSDSDLRLEGTPYTLYAKDAAQRISSLLPDVHLLFILREPVERLVSDYKFHIQRGHPSTAGTVQDFFKWQNSMNGHVPSLIDQGCYVRFLVEFLNVFGREKLHILFFENLVENPVQELRKICVKLGIDEMFYSTYNFGIHNPTVNFRSSWLNRFYIRLEPIVAGMRSSLLNKPRIYRYFERTLDFGKVTYQIINNRKSSGQARIPPDALREIARYYRPYTNMLADTLGFALPWKTI